MIKKKDLKKGMIIKDIKTNYIYLIYVASSCLCFMYLKGPFESDYLSFKGSVSSSSYDSSYQLLGEIPCL